MSAKTNEYIPVAKYPAQVEDITLVFPEKTKTGEVGDSIASNPLVKDWELTGTYRGSFTFRIWYQNPEKTLTDAEVEKERVKILQKLKEKFGGQIKD